MKKRLFLNLALMIFVVLLSFFFASVYIVHNNNLNVSKDTVMEAARICAALFNDEIDLQDFVNIGGNTRITLISKDGLVLADSRPDSKDTEGYLDRPEIQAALAGEPEVFKRYSSSFGMDYIYYALKVESNGSYIFIHAAIPTTKIDDYSMKSLAVLASLLLAVSLPCFLFSRSMIRKITKPFESVERRLRLLSMGEYAQQHLEEGYEEEIDSILRGIDEVAEIVQNGFAELWEEKTKLDYVLGSIGDGIFVLDEMMDIVLINSSALGIFDSNPEIIGRNLSELANEEKLIDTVSVCISRNENALFQVNLHSRIFQATVKQLPSGRLSMLIMSDITENTENAKLREDFFANASHELKTPLTAIKGFSELATMHNHDENLAKYLEGITRETDRMSSLIRDMLRLSKLESDRTINPSPISLAQVANDVCNTLSMAIEEKAITVDIFGDGIIEAEPEHAYGLVRNIVENAVRYNIHKGRIAIAIESGRKTVWLFVSDTGIGIAPEDQARIFERFYRVEKSRSQRGGGTGLGLSIVKHIAALYGWRVSLKSKPGKGTQISVEFVQNNRLLDH
ncbi:MAG: ATP-binding protein [Eubacteriaceae bacterium]|nr:ATP-binding protein [Eubacteriaceae bacterium]